MFDVFLSCVSIVFALVSDDSVRRYLVRRCSSKYRRCSSKFRRCSSKFRRSSPLITLRDKIPVDLRRGNSNEADKTLETETTEKRQCKRETKE